MTDPRTPSPARQEWLRTRREVIRTYHPDRGGDPEQFRRRLAEVDRRDPDLTGVTSATGAATAADRAARAARDEGLLEPRSAPVEKVLTRVSAGRRTARRVTRSVRGRIPPGWPGSRRYFEL